MWNISAGVGHPVIFVHGAFCDYRFWESQVELISKRYRTTAVSLSGYHPETFETVPSFSAELHVNEIAEFLGKQGTKVHLVGHSRGGRIVLDVAARFPDLLQSLILLEPGGLMEAGFLAAAGRGNEKPPVAGSIMAEAESLIKANKIELGARLYIDSGHGAGAWENLTPQIRHMAISNARTIIGMMKDQTVPFRKEVAVAVRCPTLLLYGDKSPDIFAQITRRLETLISQSKCILLNGADHFFPAKDIHFLNRVIMNWLDEHSSNNGA